MREAATGCKEERGGLLRGEPKYCLCTSREESRRRQPIGANLWYPSHDRRQVRGENECFLRPCQYERATPFPPRTKGKTGRAM